MRKQLISFAQVIKFCKISRSRGVFNPKTSLAYALGSTACKVCWRQWCTTEQTWKFCNRIGSEIFS